MSATCKTSACLLLHNQLVPGRPCPAPPASASTPEQPTKLEASILDDSTRQQQLLLALLVAAPSKGQRQHAGCAAAAVHADVGCSCEGLVGLVLHAAAATAGAAAGAAGAAVIVPFFIGCPDSCRCSRVTQRWQPHVVAGTSMSTQCEDTPALHHLEHKLCRALLH